MPFWVTFGSLGAKICFLGSHRPGFGRYFLCLFSEQHIGDTRGSLGFVLLNDVGIEALGSVHGCVSQLLGHGNNIRSICQEDGGGAEAAGFPELSLAHGMDPNRAENGHPQREAKGSALTKTF